MIDMRKWQEMVNKSVDTTILVLLPKIYFGIILSGKFLVNNSLFYHLMGPGTEKKAECCLS